MKERTDKQDFCKSKIISALKGEKIKNTFKRMKNKQQT